MKTVSDILKHESIMFLGSKNLYRRGEAKPYCKYLRKDNVTGKHEISPSYLEFKPHQLYLHPYFPHLDIQNIECLYDGLFYKMGEKYPGQDLAGDRWFIIEPKRLALTATDVYNLPQYFKPIYSEIASDYRSV
ncbi:MAG: hypothetical protein ABJF65_00085 [Reichenbachiella sp.]|uniref:hypothetical protein n=1 Tax=Reichenbachiella sp. TaxID=2184521 RepID=UPI0032665375